MIALWEGGDATESATVNDTVRVTGQEIGQVAGNEMGNVKRIVLVIGGDIES